MLGKVGIGTAGLLVGSALLVALAESGRSAPVAPCRTSVVHFTHYPGSGQGLGELPWVKASPATQGLVGLIAYWPEEWRTQHVTGAQIYSGGKSPASGRNTKILWAFLAPKSRQATDAQTLVAKGTRLDGPGKTWQQFHAISYTGQNRAPSFASIVDLPTPGCWRLDLTAGSLHGTTTFRAL